MHSIVMTALACTLSASAALAAPVGVEIRGASQALEQPSAERVSGTVRSANVEEKSFRLADADGKETTLSFDAKTKFVLDGQEVDATRLLAAGTKVTVSHEDHVALKVEASTKG